MKEKKYLGDGVYFKYDGSELVLTTENGVMQTNIIFLEMEVIQRLIEELQNEGIINLK